MEILQICLKCSQIWTFPRIFCSRNMVYIENYLEYFSSVWSAKKYFFQIKCWKYLRVRKVAHKKLTGVWKCILFTKRHRKAHAQKHIDRQTSKWLVIFLHNFSKIDSCYLKLHKLIFHKRFSTSSMNRLHITLIM